MRKMIFLLSFAAMAACNSNNEPKVESASSTDSAKKEKVVYPYEINYSSEFEIGDPNQAKIILNLWKDFDNGNLANSKERFADTVDMVLAGGTRMHASRDSMIASVQHYRDIFAAVTSRVDAVLATKSTDKNEDWVSVWGTEKDTYKNGKIDSVDLQETWRFDKNGKINMVLQYIREYPKKMTAKTNSK
jgi:hypothetical protein